MAYYATTNRKIIARRMKKVRRALLLTRAEMAKEFGVGALEIWRWENGKRVPRLRHQRTLYAIEIELANRKISDSTQKV